MVERHAPRMQELPSQALVGARIALAVGAYAGVVDMTHMHANLMRAAGKQVTLDKRVAVVKARGIKALEDLKGRNGLTGKGIVRNRHLDAVARGTAIPVLMVPSSMAMCPWTSVI